MPQFLISPTSHPTKFYPTQQCTQVSEVLRMRSRRVTYSPSLHPMATTVLPPELDDMIIDHLHDDPVTLGRCALVCRSWLPAVRHHSWSTIRVTANADDLARLSSLLTESPDISAYVRNVVVVQKESQGQPSDDDLQLLNPTLSILSTLSKLTTLTLDGLCFGTMDGRERNAMSQISLPLVKKLNISTCSFDSFGDVSRLCATFPALSDLRFDGVWWGKWLVDHRVQEDVDEREPKDIVPQLKLRDLDLGSCFSRDKAVDWLLKSLAHGCVEALHLPLIGAHDTRLKDLLAFVGPSLQHLDIGSPSGSTSRIRYDNSSNTRVPLASHLDLSSTTSLRSISLSVPTYRDAPFITQWLIAVLSQVTSPVLEEVRFAIYPILKTDVADAESRLGGFGWVEIAELLRGPQFAQVRKIAFCAGRRTDYLQIPSAFAALDNVVPMVVSKIFEPVRHRGAVICFEELR